jgi:hypothetical protein
LGGGAGHEGEHHQDQGRYFDQFSHLSFLHLSLIEVGVEVLNGSVKKHWKQQIKRCERIRKTAVFKIDAIG